MYVYDTLHTPQKQLPDDMASARPQNALNHGWSAYYGIKTTWSS